MSTGVEVGVTGEVVGCHGLVLMHCMNPAGRPACITPPDRGLTDGYAQTRRTKAYM